VETYVALGVIIVFCVFPIYWIVSASLKTSAEASQMPPAWWFQPNLENYFNAFENRNLGRFVLNSVIVASGSTVLAVAMGSLTAYSFSRFSFKREKDLTFWILSTRMFPPITAVLPLFLLYRQFGLIDSRQGLIIAYCAFNLGFAVWMMRGFFDQVPREIDEMGWVDGCTPWGAFVRLVLPLAKPGLAATTMVTFLFCWNEFLFALILTRKTAVTLPVGVMGFVTMRGILWGPMSAAATVLMVPMIVFAFISQKYLIRGLTFGAVKE